MKATLRRRLFLNLLGMLLVFVVVQIGVYAFIEYRGWKEHPSEPLMEEMEEVVDAVLLNLVLLPFIAAVVWWLSRRILAPLHAISATAARIRAESYSERIRTEALPDDELRNLAETLNAAFDQYQSVLKRLERFSADASHQLRTPITAIRTMGEVAVSRQRDAETYRATIGDMLVELDRLATLVDKLLQLSRLDAGAFRAGFGQVDAGSVVRQMAQIYGAPAEVKGIEVQCAAQDGLRVIGSEMLLKELMANLLDNAIRHTPNGGIIQVGAERREDQVLLYVHDTGPGIPGTYAGTIFERFAQVPGYPHGQAGLGLALAHDIASVHGGRLMLVNPGRPGARFECALPAESGQKTH